MPFLNQSNPIIQRYKRLIDTLGREGINALYPNEIEIYLLSLELVSIDSFGFEKSIDYFVFPVNPSEINISKPTLTNTKKSAGGVITLDSETFVPFKIRIQGNFGTRFRFLIGKNQQVDAKSIIYTTQNGVFSKEQMFKRTFANIPFSPQVKTGYGSFKILEAICDKSKAVNNDGVPFQLIFNNPIFGHNNIVKVKNFNGSLSTQRNRIHSYDLELEAVAPISRKERIWHLIRDTSLKSLGDKMSILSNDLQIGLNQTIIA